MGILDSVTSAVNRGTESAGRAAERVKINNKLNEVTKRRQQLAAQLGASLYPVLKDDAAIRAGREALFDGITACDQERDALQQSLQQLDAMDNAVETFKCGVCGAKMAGGDVFCSGCGTPVGQARTATVAVVVDGPACATCGAAMAADDLFCMSCGTKVAVAETKVVDAGNAPGA